MQDKDRKKFLDSVKDNLKLPNMNKIAYLLERSVKKHDKKLVDYSHIISIGTDKNIEKIDKLELKNLLIDIYKHYYNVTLSNKIEENKDKPDIVKAIEKFKNNPYYKPSETMPIFDIWSEIEQFSYRSYLSVPIYFQGNYFVQFHINKMQKTLKNNANLVDARIYLNIKPQNIIKLSDILIKKSLEKDLPILFKIAYDNKRNDNFVLYSNYKYLPKFINLIEQTKQENPKLFEGCKVKNPFMATLCGYMGFGEEPVYDSYNSIRSDLLEECYKVLSKKYAKNTDYLTKENILNTIAGLSKKYFIDKDNFCLNIPKEKWLENFKKI